MKRFVTVYALIAFATAPAVWAQQGGMEMKDHQGMDMSKPGKSSDEKAQAKSHRASGTVTKVDAAAGKVTIAHGPVQSIGWPAMSMTFKANKKMLAKLAPEKKVDFQFVQQGSDYVITRIE